MFHSNVIAIDTRRGNSSDVQNSFQSQNTGNYDVRHHSSTCVYLSHKYPCVVLAHTNLTNLSLDTECKILKF